MKKLLTITFILLLASCTKDSSYNMELIQEDTVEGNRIFDTIPVIIPIDSTRL